jgi:hypothetical protein
MFLLELVDLLLESLDLLPEIRALPSGSRLAGGTGPYSGLFGLSENGGVGCQHGQ